MKNLIFVVVCSIAFCNSSYAADGELSKGNFNLIQNVSNELEVMARRVDELQAIVDKVKADEAKLNAIEEAAVDFTAEVVATTLPPPATTEPPKSDGPIMEYKTAWTVARSRGCNLLIVNKPRSLKKVIAAAEGLPITEATDTTPGVTEVCFAVTKPQLPKSAWFCANGSCRLVAPTLIGTDWKYESKNKFWYRLVELGKSPDCKCEGDCICPNCACSTLPKTSVGVAPAQATQYPIRFGNSSRCRNGRCR